MWTLLGVFCALTCVAIGAPLTQCPKSCTCETLQDTQLKLHCTSFSYLDNLQPQQVRDVVSLEMRGRNLTRLHSKLKKLHNLQSLDLSGNRISDVVELSFLPKLKQLVLSSNAIKYFTATSLPKHLHLLDLSDNQLTYIPKGFGHLAKLRKVNLEGNPIACNCDAVKQRDVLESAGIAFVLPVRCQSATSPEGSLLQLLQCDADEDMMADEPVIEGSGDEEAVAITDLSTARASNDTDSFGEEELLPLAPSVQNIVDAAPAEALEGSGSEEVSVDEEEEEFLRVEEEGSGDEEVEPTLSPFEIPKACHFNCSDVFSIEAVSNDTSNDPDLLHEIGVAIGVVTDKVPTTSETILKEVEEVMVKDKVSRLNEKVKLDEVNSGEMKEVDESSWSTNLLIVIALIALMICLVGYSILKKRRRRRRSPEEPNMNEEMKPLNTSTKATNGNTKPPEKTPLMNGQNGNMNGKPIEETAEPDKEDELESKLPVDDYIDSPKENLLPEAHRVTVQAKELTTPKTPLLVTRHRNEDGNIITTPNH